MKRRRTAIWIFLSVIAAALAVFAALFDWNWLRGPLGRYASGSLQREVRLGALEVRLGSPIIVTLRDLRIANPQWMEHAAGQRMAQVEQVELAIKPLSLVRRPVVLPYVRLRNAEASLLRLQNGRANWQLAISGPDGKAEEKEDAPADAAPPAVIQALHIQGAQLRYQDAQLDIDGQADIQTRDDPRYPTDIAFDGRWRLGKFRGRVEAGDALSLHNPEQPIALRLQLRAQNTQVQAEGELSDLAGFERIDADFRIAGPSLGDLYPTLLIALPASPPYELQGRLRKEGNRYAYGDFRGKIGTGDISGSGEFVIQQPRPRLTATLSSKTLNAADFGPMIGVQQRAAARADRPTSSAAGKQVKQSAPQGSPNAAADPPIAQRDGRPAYAPPRLLPDVDIDAQRLRALDADVRLAVQSLNLPAQLRLQDVQAHVRLDDARLRIDPLRFGFAGGSVMSRLQLDGQKKPAAAALAMELRRLQLPALFPAVKQMQTSRGRLAAQIELRGQGLSVADLLGNANGSMAVAMDGGRVSRLALAAASLNGGRLLQLLIGGDEMTPVRCAGMALDFKSGIGDVKSLVFDTEHVVVHGDGLINLQLEVFEMDLLPQPKEPGILSLRAPVRVRGSFRGAELRLDKTAALRGGAAIALGLVNPLAALLPLIETGPGEDSDCRAVLAPVKSG